MTLNQAAVSKEYIRVAVSATVAGVTHDPTGDVVEMAFKASGVDPLSGDWVSGSWETIGGTHYALCLVGPGGTITLAKATYDVWIRVTDSPEVPARKVDTLVIF